MSNISRVQTYFTRSAIRFDSLYSHTKTGRLSRFINHTFRRDIYERFLLTIDYVRRHDFASVLDVGCGSGRYEEAFMRRGVRRIVGVDVSAKMLELAKANTAGSGTSNQPEFACCDFAEFQPGEPFDLVVAMGFFDYVADPLTVLSHMRSLATHSVVASFPSVSWYRTFIRRTRYLVKRCPVFFYTAARINALGRSVDFARTDIVKIRGAGQDYFVTFTV